VMAMMLAGASRVAPGRGGHRLGKVRCWPRRIHRLDRVVRSTCIKESLMNLARPER